MENIAIKFIKENYLTILWPGNVSGLKANGSSFKKNGSNITANGPITSEIYELQEIHEDEPDRADENGVPGARSTDLIFLKSVVLTNTLERPKKVCVSNFLLLPQIPRKSKNLMVFDKWNSAQENSAFNLNEWGLFDKIYVTIAMFQLFALCFESLLNIYKKVQTIFLICRFSMNP